MNDLFAPLSDKERDWLDQFILGRFEEGADTLGKDEGVLCISELDGLFAAVVSGPIVIMPSQWLPALWGDFEPEWEDGAAFETVMSLLMRYMNSTAAHLIDEPESFEPLFLERRLDGEGSTIVDEWCEGYMRGVDLAAEQWQLNEPHMKILLAPITAFAGEAAMDTHDSYGQQEIKNIQDAIAPNVREIHAYWLARRGDVPVATPVRRDEARVGRNEACPCGSGKKYKKCCLH